MIDMGAAFAQTRFGDSDAKVAARRGFKGYGPSKRRVTKKTEVVEDRVLNQLRDAWSECEVNIETGWTDVFPRLENMLALLEGIEYSSADVEKFSLILGEFQHEKDFGEKAGCFLTALIKAGSDREYTIHTEHLDVELHYLAFRNEKNVTIMGNAGSYVGHNMSSGTVTVTGNAGAVAGNGMWGGTLVIKGNAGDRLGRDMNGGKILVEKNAGRYVGCDDSHQGGLDPLVMKDGEIEILGDTGEYAGAWISGGTIIVRGSVGPNAGRMMGSRGTMIIEKDAGDNLGDWTSGTIFVHGRIASIGEIISDGMFKGGSIYHKGKLISEND